MGKITVKHYLNKSIARISKTDDSVCQIYVQITVKRQVNKIRSRAYKFVELKDSELQVTQKEFELAQANKDKGVGKAIFLEYNFVKDLISFLKPFEREDFSVKDIASIYEIAISKVYEDLDFAGKKTLVGLLHGDWQKVQNIINWQLPFNDILDGLELIGKKNKAFEEDILWDEYLVSYKIAIRHIKEFLLENIDQTNYGLGNCNSYMLYWIKNSLHKNYLQYLADKKLITPDHTFTMQKVLKSRSNSTQALMMHFSDKKDV
jgi:hypothetical protein